MKFIKWLMKAMKWLRRHSLDFLLATVVVIILAIVNSVQQATELDAPNITLTPTP